MKRISILAIILYLVFTYNLKAADHTILNIKDDDWLYGVEPPSNEETPMI